MICFVVFIVEQIWDMKYWLKGLDGVVFDLMVQDSWCCVVYDLVCVEVDFVVWQDCFYYVLQDFCFLFVGCIFVGVGIGCEVMLFNCFVMGIIFDSMEGIFQVLKEVVLIMQQGGGIGYDFSMLWFKGVVVYGVVVDVLGLLSFMDVWDVMCCMIMLVGLCWGVMMVMMCCDYFDIEVFIVVKQDSVRLCMFNLLVLVMDGFMQVVCIDGLWDL